MSTETASPTARPEVAASAALVEVLVSALEDLAEAGQGDEACRLAARAWAALRDQGPAQAARLDRLLHRLTRPPRASGGMADEESGPSGGETAPGTEPAAGHVGPVDAVLDVRPLAPAARHTRIFTAFGALVPGEGFLLVNDHDPKPLYYQLRAEHPGAFTWEPVESGPLTWKVRLGCPPGADRPGAA
ncbi:MAG: DUF2249 domain-containing protein [Acidimicrobiales bacterium]